MCTHALTNKNILEKYNYINKKTKSNTVIVRKELYV